jgi:dihydroorotase
MKMLLIKNGRVIDPANGVDDTLDILIEAGKISRLEPEIKEAGAEPIDAAGLIVAPGFIDMHVHLREPGREDKETIKTGTEAAAYGGFTSVACMPNTSPVNDSGAVTDFIIRKAKEEGTVNVFPIGAATKGSKGEELAEIGEMMERGIVAVSDDGNPIGGAQMMRRILEYTKMFDIPVIDHCEDLELTDNGVMNEGYYSTLIGLAGIPAPSEDVMVARDIILADYTRGRVHIAHLSTRGSLALVTQAKKNGIKVTCEVTPHHFTLTDEVVGSFDTNTKMKPPLRSKEDVAAIIEGIKEGVIDAIASDHAPHTADEKNVEYDLAPFGIVGLETAVPLALDRLVHREKISLNRIIEMFTINPARVLGIDRGTLSHGVDADITIIDLTRTVEVDPERFKSKSRNTPFAGFRLQGMPVMTIVRGKIVFDGIAD